VSKKKKRVRAKRINVYLDDSMLEMKDGQEVIVQSVVMAPHHGDTQMRLFYGGEIQYGPQGKSGRGRISRPPGSRLSALADFFCSPKTMERVVLPILSDLQTEHFDALAEGKTAKARGICVRGYGSFWMALSFYKVVKRLMEIWKISKLG
jgi:hypothetical protein